jgi:hypothetical protein
VVFGFAAGAGAVLTGTGRLLFQTKTNKKEGDVNKYDFQFINKVFCASEK